MPEVHPYGISDHWDGPLDVSAFEAWARALRKRLVANAVDLGFVFATPGYDDVFGEILEILQIHCQIPELIGCTGNSLVSQGFEYEHGEGISVALHSLPGAEVTGFELSGTNGGEAFFGDGWELPEQMERRPPNGFLLFADPFSLPAEPLLEEFNRRFPGLPVLGGLACGTQKVRRTTLFHNHSVIESGAVGVAIGGRVALESVISQGCQPVGDSFTVTSAEKNVLDGIGNRKAYEVLSDVFEDLPDSMKLKSRGNLHVGFVIDEYRDGFARGDFLVRNLIGADPNRGALLVGAHPRVGQTLQFQLRDRHAAMEDMNNRLGKIQQALGDRAIFGALLSTCTGRGKSFFKVPDFDAGSIQESLGPVGMAGFFGNGEFGPVGGRNFVHGYTASLALFVEKVA